MKKPIFIFSSFVILLFFNSCDDIYDKEIVCAGKYDSSYIYREFSPVLKINTEMDSLSNIYSGKDSIDFDLDGNFDVILSTQFLLNDSLARIKYTDINTFFRIYFKNDYEMATKEMPYSCGHGQCNYMSLICPLEFNTDIDNLLDWQKGSSKNLWFENLAHLRGVRTWWYKIESEEMYIGIRKAIMSLENKPYYRYGWIKVNAISLKEISFTSYAIEQ